ncbi:DUF2071 domain-containing protein [Nocardioides carbamazepini]|uniref:DUF2071 domain-containing protein n=1 Tax=Nocardioides carbamazepini TaxID=2854259 RepID=UPI002149E943|nr:DUF2071 domain-containing protein [Nocardioides carbamazepini]MCR1786607.1 DUF2071 domain-containing protein [Nocardioides carbamazepini]
MRLPEIQGQIERRLLVNYRVDPEAITRVLPDRFRPQLIDGAAVAGICLIRLGQIRPMHTPRWIGLGSENAAHRIAVEWETDHGTQTGVYIPRRDTNSRANVLLGGRLYPGEHHRARFHVDETDTEIRVGYESCDGTATVDVAVRAADQLDRSRLFQNLEEASAFFESGAVGYSATAQSGQFDGLKLRTTAWKIEPTSVIHAHSSFFDAGGFPAGTVELDSALLMRRVPVVWESLPSLPSQTSHAA